VAAQAITMNENKKPELIALGTGTCLSGMGWEKKERWPSGYLLKGIAPDLVLLEVSEGVRYRIQDCGEEYTDVSDIFISHFHPDHFNPVPFVQSIAIKHFRNQAKFRRDSLRIFGPEGIETAFWKIWDIKVPEHLHRIYGLLNIDFVELGNNQRFKFYDCQLQSFQVFHAFEKIKALAFRLVTPQGIFTYSGDSGPCSALEKAAKEANSFLCESSSDIGEDKSTTSGHLNPYQAGNLAKKANVERLLLTHYSGKDSPQKMTADCRKSGFTGEIQVLQDGDKLSL
jgi:ribonuclease BN (tRNA processing enzyme)